MQEKKKKMVAKGLVKIWTKYSLYSIFRRLNTLNKCAIMKIGTPTKKEVSSSLTFICVSFAGPSRIFHSF